LTSAADPARRGQTNDSDPRYVDEPTCELLGHVNVDLKEVMRLHLDQRTVQVSMRFGETEIKTRVVLVETGRELEHSLELLTA
jgi:hypothetical protein